MQKTTKDWSNVLDIPEGKSGAFEIKHVIKPPGTTLDTANSRTSIIGGHTLTRILFERATRWHSLLEGDSVWMSDYPIEQAQHDAELKPITSGRVLVGGLGLGYAATQLARRPRITEVVVIEKSPDVLALVADHLCNRLDDARAKRKLTFECSDLFDYLRALPAQETWKRRSNGCGNCNAARRRSWFDYAFYDIWASDGEYTFFETVVPLLELSAERVRREPINWNESVMRGQLFLGLQSRHMMATHPRASEVFGDAEYSSLDTLCEYKDVIWHDWRVPFFRWVKKDSPPQEDVDSRAALYARIYGRRTFTHTWEVLTGISVTRDSIKREETWSA